MGELIELRADDGHVLGAYRADPQGAPRGGVVVIQEVFGLNRHIRALCDEFAGDGYRAVAPALFDRIERGIELDYDEAGLERGRELRAALGWNDPLVDIGAAVATLKADGAVGVVGYCWGGSVAWLAATRLDVTCAVGYYGGQIVLFKDEHPSCPVMLHFGERDALIPSADVEEIRAAQPGVEIHSYPAGHGFNCPDRPDHDAASASRARTRTLAFLAQHLGTGRGSS